MRWHDVAVLTAAVLSPLAVGAVSWAATRLSGLMTVRLRGDAQQSALTRIDEAAFTVVREMEQVTVNAFRSASPRGTLGTNIPSLLHRAALGRVRDHLGPKQMSALAQALGLDGDAVNRLIGTRIEAAVYELKRQRGARPADNARIAGRGR